MPGQKMCPSFKYSYFSLSSPDSSRTFGSRSILRMSQSGSRMTAPRKRKSILSSSGTASEVTMGQLYSVYTSVDCVDCSLIVSLI